MIVALCVVMIVVSSIVGISSGAIQVRPSEALNMMKKIKGELNIAKLSFEI